MRKSLFFTSLSFMALSTVAQAQSGTTRTMEYPFEQNPQACDCYPASASSKRYVSEGYQFPFGEWKTYTCDFVCLDREGRPTTIKGTQRDGYSFSESGRNFVCQGYEMRWIDTPMARDRLGYLTIGAIRPFRAGRSDIPELEDWAQRAGCR